VYVAGWDPAKDKEFIIKDNVSAGQWDWEMLANEWDESKLNEWGLDVPEWDTVEAEAEEDNFEVPDDVQTDIVLGDLFEIGEHRLLCGDSTDSDQVAKLIDGKWNLVFTSPPYNQGGMKGDLLHTKGLGVGKKKASMYRDKNADKRTSEEYYKFCQDIFLTSYLHRSNEHSFVWNVAYNSNSRDDYGKIVFSDDNPFTVKETIIWDKTNSINLPHVGIYSRRCEFLFVMSDYDKYRTSQEYNDWRWNYYQIKSAGSQVTGTDIEHRATYPVELASRVIKDFSITDDWVYDPFMGSGTTMVASHQLNRKCYGMELDPLYCQMIIDRMRKLDPTLEIKRNGQPYGTAEIQP